MKSTSWIKIASLVFLAAVGVGVARTAAATTDGGAGPIVNFRVNTPSNSAYGYYHQHINIGGELYFSGGEYCEGVAELSDAQLQLLATFMVHGRTLNPTYEVVGGNKCLSSFFVYPE